MKARGREMDYKALLYGLGRVVGLFPSRIRSMDELRRSSAVPLLESDVLKRWRIRNENAKTLHEALHKIQEGEAQVESLLHLSEISRPGKGMAEEMAKGVMGQKDLVRVVQRRAEGEGKGKRLDYVFADHEGGISDMLALSEDWAAVAADLREAKRQVQGMAEKR